MSSKPRSWAEIQKRRSRGQSSESPLGATSSSQGSVRLVTEESFIENEHAIRDFKGFRHLREIYADLKSLPILMYRDWILCCKVFLEKDIVGNTPEENFTNTIVSRSFLEFEDIYETLMKDSSIDEDVRRQQIHKALLVLLRSLLSKPSHLSTTILEQTLDKKIEL